MSGSARLRALWWRLHRWIALTLALLLVPIALSAALLVCHDELDALIHPGIERRRKIGPRADIPDK